MATLLSRRSGYICRSCRLAQISHNPHSVRALSTSRISLSERPSSLRQQLAKKNPTLLKLSEDATASSAVKRTRTVNKNTKPIIQTVIHDTNHESKQSSERVSLPPSPVPIDTTDPKNALRKIQEYTLRILDADRIPEDAQTLEIMDQSYQFANLLIFGPNQEAEEPITDKSSLKSDSSLLSDLEESHSATNTTSNQPQISNMSLSFRESAAQSLCETLFTLLEDPKVFITEPILSAYVRIVCLLGKPEFIPKIFYLYASKPIPKPGTYPIRYREPWSKLPKYAVPRKLADAALDAAILRKDMGLCISIIDTTVATDSFMMDKLLRKALLPVSVAGMTIPISWSVSTWAAQYQQSWDPNTFFWMCMSGAGAYLGTMGTLLWISVSTWNDHHRRVRWVPGTPFGRRLVREEERLYFDRIAQAWGYKDEFKFGEESGEEWEALREILAVRYMDLDRSELLPGMI